MERIQGGHVTGPGAEWEIVNETEGMAKRVEWIAKEWRFMEAWSGVSESQISHKK